MQDSQAQKVIMQSLNEIDESLSSKELDELLKSEGLLIDKHPVTIHIESSKSLEEPLSLNSRIINLGRTQTVTLLACKVIYNAYRENDLTTLIRVGIIPNYTELLDDSLALLELLRLFVNSFKHPADIQYVNTPGMTMKEYKKLVSRCSGDYERCENLLKSLKLNDNYALYILHYNLLSGSTIIQEPERFVKEAKKASNILVEHLNTTSKDVDVKVILTRYQTLKTTYEEVIKLKKETIASKLNSTFNKTSQLANLVNHFEESYNENINKLSKIESIVESLDESRQTELLSKLHKLYEEQFIQLQRNQSGIETDLLNKSLQTLAMYEKNYTVIRKNLSQLKDNLNSLVLSEDIKDSELLEDIVKKVKSLLVTQKNYKDTIAHLKHVATELVDVGNDETENE